MSRYRGQKGKKYILEQQEIGYLWRKLALETIELVSVGAESSHSALFGNLSQVFPSSQFPEFLASF